MENHTATILAIETSCDETAVAVLEAEGGFERPRFRVLAHELFSQASTHAEYGGVFPLLAKREHAKNLVPLLREALKRSGVPTRDSTAPTIGAIAALLSREPEELRESLERFVAETDTPALDGIAVTHGPGLEPALWVGLNAARALAAAWRVPLVPINHMEGHILSVLVGDEGASNIVFPALALLISGGHTELVLSRGWLDYEILGATRDDAVGEAYDKVARLLGLPYPGGPEISRLADAARRDRYDDAPSPVFPRPMLESGDYDFSFSGLKTAVRYFVEKHAPLSDALRAEVAREFEDAVVETLVGKTRRALEEFAPKTFIAAGGVMASARIRAALKTLAGEFSDTRLLVPSRELSTDNAAMIGIAGYFRLLADTRADENIRAVGNLRLKPKS